MHHDTDDFIELVRYFFDEPTIQPAKYIKDLNDNSSLSRSLPKIGPKSVKN